MGKILLNASKIAFELWCFTREFFYFTLKRTISPRCTIYSFPFGHKLNLSGPVFAQEITT